MDFHGGGGGEDVLDIFKDGVVKINFSVLIE